MNHLQQRSKTHLEDFEVHHALHMFTAPTAVSTAVSTASNGPGCPSIWPIGSLQRRPATLLEPGLAPPAVKPPHPRLRQTQRRPGRVGRTWNEHQMNMKIMKWTWNEWNEHVEFRWMHDSNILQDLQIALRIVGTHMCINYDAAIAIVGEFLILCCDFMWSLKLQVDMMILGCVLRVVRLTNEVQERGAKLCDIGCGTLQKLLCMHPESLTAPSL